MSSVIRGYLLIYMGWLLSILFSLIIAFLVGYVFFGSDFTSLLHAAINSNDGDVFLATFVVGSLIYAVLSVIAFQFSILILCPLFVYLCLSRNPVKRMKTCVLIFIFYLLTPLFVLFSVFISHSSFYITVGLTIGWIVFIPFIARKLAVQT